MDDKGWGRVLKAVLYAYILTAFTVRYDVPMAAYWARTVMILLGVAKLLKFRAYLRVRSYLSTVWQQQQDEGVIVLPYSEVRRLRDRIRFAHAIEDTLPDKWNWTPWWFLFVMDLLCLGVAVLSGWENLVAATMWALGTVYEQRAMLYHRLHGDFQGSSDVRIG